MKANKTQAKKRVRPLTEHSSFKLSKKKLKQNSRLPSVWQLAKNTHFLIKSHPKLFFGITFLNFILTFVFVQGLGSSFEINDIKNNFQELLGDSVNQLQTAIILLGYLTGSAGTNAGQGSGSYQMLFVLLFSLATIWSIRQVLAGRRPKIRESFYQGMYPLIPFLTILFVIALQFIPLAIGNLIYATATQNGLASTPLEQVIWFLLFIFLALLTLYMLTSSIFALYISTLPDMTPLKALRSARELVLHRRIGVALRIIVLPLFLALVFAVVLIPLLIYLPLSAQVVFLLLSSYSLVVVHAYMYLLYRSLL